MVSSDGLEYVIGSSPDRPISVIWEFSSTNRALNSIAYFATADDADKWLNWSRCALCPSCSDDSHDHYGGQLGIDWSAYPPKCQW
jgi:hypothetical protein